jgi:hypothetical protein
MIQEEQMAIKRLDTLNQELNAGGEAFAGLDDEIAHIGFEPTDEASVQAALEQIESAIDARVAKYPGNPIISATGTELKDEYRQMIVGQVKK